MSRRQRGEDVSRHCRLVEAAAVRGVRTAVTTSPPSAVRQSTGMKQPAPWRPTVASSGAPRRSGNTAPARWPAWQLQALGAATRPQPRQKTDRPCRNVVDAYQQATCGVSVRKQLENGMDASWANCSNLASVGAYVSRIRASPPNRRSGGLIHTEKKAAHRAATVQSVTDAINRAQNEDGA